MSGASPVPDAVYEQLARYLVLLLKWNARTNLTAIRDPGGIVIRHFGESLFAAQQLGTCSTLLDFGSGAGFPGVPIQLLRPDIRVTLAESQNKKASFLREVVRSLNLNSEVWAGRVDTMAKDRSFDIVTLRAVDNMQLAVREAAQRANRHILVFSGGDHAAQLDFPPDFAPDRLVAIPCSRTRTLQLLTRISPKQSPDP